MPLKTGKILFRIPYFWLAMYQIKNWLLIASAIFSFTALNAQDSSKFLLLGGHEFTGVITETTKEYLRVNAPNKKGQFNETEIAITRIFSVTTNGTEKVYYQVDKNDSTQYTVEEMRMFIYGQQDAKQNHKTTIPMIVGGGVSAGLAFYAGSQKSAVVLAAPLVGSIVGSLSYPNRPKAENARNEEVLKSPAYIEGYRKGARTKKVIRTIGTSIVGMIVGGIGGFIIAD